MFNQLLFITAAIVYVVEISGFSETLGKLVWRFLYGQNFAYKGWRLPLFGCSKCLTFWVCLFVTLFSGYGLIYSFVAACTLSYLAFFIWKLLTFVSYAYELVLDKIVKCLS